MFHIHGNYAHSDLQLAYCKRQRLGGAWERSYIDTLCGCVLHMTVELLCVQELHEMFYDLAVLVEEQVTVRNSSCTIHPWA